MTPDEFKQHRWLAIYGASVAVQAHQNLMDGKGHVLPEDMKHIMEEAGAVADLEAELAPPPERIKRTRF